MFPAEALARELSARGWKVVLATDSRGDQYAHAFPADERIALNAATFRTTDPIGAVRGAFKIMQGVGQARAAFRRLDPAVVIGFGGYPSLPALLAAKTQGRATIIHEQNAVLGRVNRMLAGSVSAVACAFPILEKASPRVKAAAQVVGNPVRPDIQALHDRGFTAPKDRINLLVTGGSQGARLLSETVPRAVALLSEPIRQRLKVDQQSRPENLDAARAIYAAAKVEAQVAPFFREMATRLGAAHLMIGRAGASTCCEIAVAGVPSVLIPLKIAMDDHQRFNARQLVEAGGAVAIDEDALTADGLANTLQALLSDSRKLVEMARAARSVGHPDAASRLADLVEKVA
jgi:UDP-N-acetylglucosamine--N-acetylmuramyl-(pentapeptide) pyrophosphoryl-undecaprenol N-acetylglucosamine transferase